VQHLRERLAYVKGLTQSSDKDPVAQNARVTREILKLLEEVIAQLDDGNRGNSLQQQPRGNGNGGNHADPPLPDAPFLHCPRCRQYLLIGNEQLTQETFELTCSECSLVVQVT